MAPRLQAEHDLAPAELDAIEEHLNSDNRLLTGRDDDRGLVFALRDESGRAVGVAAGYSWAGIAELKLMWVEESHRRRGHAKALLDAFVAEAAARGARRIWVSTHDFQAPGLYENAGFERMAEFAGWPEGHSSIILCKTMARR
ncbi:N-acetyltransferase [Mesorhizobium sp. M1C.F.Ca.ET.193.01.1.1]|uniref:GNAT family N-acetyltransferase n=1 Tax=unclassified Mesorhizobium TaxID=325217 RepID=UPI000FD4F48B|nr:MULTISPECIES: GNAT family N-acetyltransferase [unclassified Mesorhizobium]TGT01301.1 N-acetyltransferase [bacterium M00.F.Ca.ET.177.01.1.1]TGQ54064.1 N-acetyltransferase [Mesorhizobium sp. M1C.F.Ca.ET.210.01.1.1]TGQ72078.1 N-acetyltransferase [Mesorhizobium sp. M1C.F.Ca.ET.212.01.1.1]TGR09891.1 N-acetyltransferase [Mesorhizobium sp. M1C.F.Ca.ET.204.01.1.1]TGR30013.1 N-acetyltransferase [Mesorhizobium sp. M1C.F.Ca.ET.196.01.1.1]